MTAFVLVVLCLSIIFMSGCTPHDDIGYRETPDGEAHFTMVSLPVDLPDPNLPIVPWVDDWNGEWDSSVPTFTIADQGCPTSAKGWVAVSDHAILLNVVVQESVHENHQTGGGIFDGDSIQVAIDARGDGSGTLPADTRMVNLDDGIIAFALTDTGPQAWAHHLGKVYNGGAGNPDGAMPRLGPRITRDETVHQTVYQITLPWAEFHTGAGFTPIFGMAMQLNVGSGKARKELYWGKGAAGGVPMPGSMNKLLLGPPPRPTVTLTCAKDRIWTAEDTAEVEVSVFSPLPYRLEAQCGAVSEKWAIPAADNSGLRRYLVRLSSSNKQQDIPVQVRVLDEARRVTEAQMTVSQPNVKLESLCQRLTILEKRANHPLVKQSLQNLQSAARDIWARAIASLKNNDGLARNTLEWITSLNPLLRDDMADWRLYVQGYYQLMIAFKSPSDGSLQFYKVRLPGNFELDKTYPVIFSLHGGGLRNVLEHAQADLVETQKQIGQENDRVAQNTYFEVKPFVGKLGYLGQGGIYTWEQILDMEKTFHVNPDRRYLEGGSMGGYGTWALGSRVPDHWAALDILAFGMPSADAGVGYGRNISYLPIYIAIGDHDPYFPLERAFALRDEIRNWGNEPHFAIIENCGHGLPPSLALEVRVKMLKHSRARPDHFQFVTTDDRYRSCWGITLFRKPEAHSARFECSIAGNTVTLTTEHATGVQVDAGPDGLNLRSPVRVVWNGSEAYSGSAASVRLGIVP